jgi:hypothetical protein
MTRWLKVKNPDAPAVQGAKREEDWGRRPFGWSL